MPPGRGVAEKIDSGLGDIQLLTLMGPNKGEELVWGAGLTFKFPLASKVTAGQGKYQAGPAAMAFHMGKPWVLGLLAQHWVSVGGDTTALIPARLTYNMSCADRFRMPCR